MRAPLFTSQFGRGLHGSSPKPSGIDVEGVAAHSFSIQALLADSRRTWSAFVFAVFANIFQNGGSDSGPETMAIRMARRNIDVRFSWPGFWGHNADPHLSRFGFTNHNKSSRIRIDMCWHVILSHNETYLASEHHIYKCMCDTVFPQRQCLVT